MRGQAVSVHFVKEWKKPKGIGFCRSKGLDSHAE